LGSLGGYYGFFAGEMSVPRTHAIKRSDLVSPAVWFRFRSEIESDIFPRISTLCLEAQAGRRFVTAMDHAVLTARIPGHAVNASILFPFHFLQQFDVARVVDVGHQITGSFPAPNISGWNSPR